MKRIIPLCVAVCLLFAAASSRAASGSWTNNADGKWSVTTNWLGGTVATGVDAIAYFTNTISASRTVTNDFSPLAIGRLNFSSGANSWTLNGNPIALSLSAVGSATVTVSSATATVNTAISGGTNLLKVGTGALVLSGTNSYVGGTTISAGTLSVYQDANLGSTNGNISIAGGTLQVLQSFTNLPPRALNVTAAGTLDVPAGIVYCESNSYGGGNFALTKTGPGTFVIMQTTVNSGETGPLTISGGTVLLTGGRGDGTQHTNITIASGAMLKYGYVNPVVNSCVVNINAGGLFDCAGFGDTIGFLAGAGTATNWGTMTLALGTSTNTFSGSIYGTGTLTVNGNAAGVQILSGTNYFTGAVTLQAGRLSVSSDDNLAGPTKAITFSGGTLQITGATITNLDTHTVNWTTFNGGIDIANIANIFTITNVIAGTGAFTKYGTGTVVLTSANSYSGATTVAGGTLDISTNSSIGSKVVNVYPGAQLIVENSNAFTNMPSLYISTVGGYGKVNLSAVSNASASYLYFDATMQAPGTWGATGSSALFTNNNMFIGTGIVTVANGLTLITGDGSWITNASGGWSDTNNWQLATLAYGTNSTAYFTNALTADRIVNNGFAPLPIGNLVFGSPTNNWSVTNNTINLTVNSGTPVINVITNIATISSVVGGTQGLNKIGSGILALGSSDNYTGPTTINAGTLMITNNGGLYAAGTLAGSVAVSSNAILSFARQDSFGVHSTFPNVMVTNNQGGLIQNVGPYFNTMRDLTLNGGELRANGGNGTTWPAYQLKGTVTVSGTSASLISANALVNGNHQIQLGNNLTNGVTVFNVPDITGDGAPDLIVQAGFIDGRSTGTGTPMVPSGFVKTGPGTMLMSGSSVNTGPSIIDGSTVVLTGSGALNAPLTLMSGATLVATPGAGLLGEYYFLGGTGPVVGQQTNLPNMSAYLGGMNPSYLYNMSTLITNFDFGTTGAGAYFPLFFGWVTNYQARWIGKFNAPTNGQYVFDMTSDDFSYLWIDGTNIITRNAAGGPSSNRVTLASGLHDIVFAFAQGTGNYYLFANVGLPGTTNTSRLSSAMLISGPGVGPLSGSAGCSVVLSNTVLTVSQTNNTTFDAVISGTGSHALRKLGLGTLTLTAVNTYTNTILGGGRVNVADDSQVGGASSALTFDGGLLQITGTTISNLDAHNVNWNSFNGGFDVADPSNNLLVTNNVTIPVAAGILSKYGAGTMTLLGSNSLAGNLVMNQGTLIISNTTAIYGNLIVNQGVTLIPGATHVWYPLVNNSPFAAQIGSMGSGTATGVVTVTAGGFLHGSNANIQVGFVTNSKGILNIQPDALVMTEITPVTGTLNSGNQGHFYLGEAVGAVGVVNQYGGTNIIADQFIVGHNAGGYGFYNMAGGVLNENAQSDPWITAIARFRIAGTGTGIYYQTAGTVTAAHTIEAAINGANDLGVIYVSGGTLTGTSAGNSMNIANSAAARGEVTITGGAPVALAATVQVGGNASAAATINVNGSSLRTTQILTGGGTSIVNFAGATIQAAASSTTFMQGLSGAYIYPGNTTFDTSNFNITVAQNLLMPPGVGVISIPVTNGGSGYIGVPYVAITGGSGANATAISQIDNVNGTVTNIVITNPGINFSNAPTATLLGGGGTNAGTGTILTSPNGSGGLIKSGIGALTLAGTNTYGGMTTISNGVIIVSSTNAIPGAITIVTNTAGIGATYPIDASFINWLTSRLTGGSSPGIIVIGTNTATPIDLTSLPNVSLGAAGGSWVYSGNLMMPGTNLYFGNANGTLIYAPNIGTGTNVFIGFNGLATFPPVGAVQLNGTNTAYAGTINVVSGTLKAGGTNSLGGASANVNVASGTSLDINSQNLGAVQINVLGTGVGTNGAIMNGGLDQVVAVQKVRLMGDTTIGGPARWDINNIAGNGFLDLANFTLTKTNTNITDVWVPNVSDGNIVVGQGIFRFEVNGSITGGVGNITVGPSGTLNFWNHIGSITRAVTMQGGVMSVSSNIANIGSAVTLAGATNTFSPSTGSSLVLTGLVDGTGALLKNSPGLLKLTRSETYSGPTIVSAGQLELASTDAINGTLANSPGLTINGSGVVSLDNGTALFGSAVRQVTIAGGGLLTITNGASSHIASPFTLAGGTLAGNTPDVAGGNWVLDTSVVVTAAAGITAPRTQLGGTGTVTFDVTNGTYLSAAGAFENVPGGTGTLVKAGLGTMIISAANNYSGATIVSAGTLKLAAASPVGGLGLWLDSSDASTISQDSSNRVSQWNDKSGNGRNATQTNQANKALFMTNALLNKAVLRFSGNPMMMNVDLSFLANNSYSIFAVEGRTSVSNVYFLGTQGAAATNNLLHFGYRDNVTFTLAQFSDDLNASGSFLPGYTNQIFRLWNGCMDFAGGKTIYLNGQGVSTNVAETAPLLPTLGPGVLGMGNGAYYLGDLAEIMIYNRSLTTNERKSVEGYLMSKWLGSTPPTAANYLPVATALRLAPGATFDLGGVSQAVGSLSDLSGAGALVTNSSAPSVTFALGNDNSNATFSGPIAEGAGVISLAKNGTGTQTLHGALSCSGTLAINNGTLIINALTGTGDVSVVSGGTLGGTGVIGGTVSANGGTLAPGSSAGRLTLSQSCFISSGGTLAIELGGPNAGTDYDQLIVSNSAGIGTGTLNVTLINGYMPTNGSSFTILTAGTLLDQFGATNSLPALSSSNLGWSVQYDTGSSPNAVILSVTSAPTATGYDAWAAGISGPLTNYNDSALGDGYPNLLKYATGSSPTNSDGRAQMNSTQTNGLFALKFNHNTNTTDLILYVEGAYTTTNDAPWVGIATNDHGSWGSATNVSEDASTDPATDVVWDTDATATNRFLRLRVTRP